MAAKGSFAQRMAAMAPASIENWDDDADFEGHADLFAHSISTLQSTSSRVSVRSESNTGDDDWQVLLTPNDERSTMNAISSAKQAGIPIPTSVPSSALLGGQIKRLGKKNSNRKIAVDDDWGNDLELPTDPSQGLKLKVPTPATPADGNDDFDDWGEGSLGIRFAGTRREGRGARSSCASAMSPSMGSIMTLESEDDDLTGLVLPTEPLDFNARLEKLKVAEMPTPDASPSIALQKQASPTHAAPVLAPPIEFAPFSNTPHSPPTPFSGQHAPVSSPPPASKLQGLEDEDDFLDGIDLGGVDVLDSKKLTLNRNVLVKKAPQKAAPPPAARPATTLTFTDKPDKPSHSKIPRPLSISSRTRLTPVYESGAPQNGHNRPMPTTTSAQFLRAKRSAPMLRNNHVHPARSSAPFLPAGTSTAQSHHAMTKAPSHGHLRRDSDPRRPHSPSMRPFSRTSTATPVDTPSRNALRRDPAPGLARQQKMTLPTGRKRNFGDGTELEIFDDLPTSATKEKQFEKTPRNVPSNKTLRQQSSISRLPMPDRMVTPMPQTPRSPPRPDTTPRFARDTAASRNAREQRLATIRARGDGPIAPTQTNWKVHVAAKSPHTSPTAHRKRGSGQKPHLIRGLFEPYAKTEKGMIYNPSMQRWEGNEEALAPFTHPNTSTATLDLTTVSTPTFAPPNNSFGHSHERSHSISHTALSQIQMKNVSSRAVKVLSRPAPSPPRPALISQKTMPRGVQYEGRMVFDPVKMTWLKAPRVSDDPRSPSVDMDDEEDPFAGLEDLKDNESVVGHGAGGGNGNSGVEDPTFVGEEFDLGPSFIRRQREEELIWRRRTESWVSIMRDDGDQKYGWRWAIRSFAQSASEAQGR